MSLYNEDNGREQEKKDEISEEEFNELMDEESDLYDEDDEDDEQTKGLPKRRGNLKKIMTVSLVIILVFTVGIFGAIQLDKMGKSYVMTFNGEKISINDYKLCLLFQQNSESAKDDALSQLIDFLIIEKAAKDLGITLSDDEKTEVASEMDSLKGSISAAGLVMPEITEERLKEIVSVNLYFERLVEELGKDFTVDEADFGNALEDYRLNNRQDYIDVKLKYILAETKEKAEEARQKVLSGIPMDDVIKEYSADFEEASGISIVSLKDISLDQDTVEKILAMKVSEITDVLDLGGAFIVFGVSEINIPEEEELKASFREAYIQNKKYEIFENELIKWRNNAIYSINQKAIDAIE